MQVKTWLLLVASALLLGWGCGARNTVTSSGSVGVDGGSSSAGSIECGVSRGLGGSAAVGAGDVRCGSVSVGVGRSGATAAAGEGGSGASTDLSGSGLHAAAGSGAALAGANGGSAAAGTSGGTTAGASGGGAAAGTSGGGGACADARDCSASYPCQPLAPNYTCRGQFADWVPTDSPSFFTDNGDGTVTDARSGRQWQRTLPAVYPSRGCSGSKHVAGDTCTWRQASDYCSQLALAGTDWRLPTRAELESIVDFGRSAPAIDPKVFTNIPEDQYSFWSSSPYVDPAGTGVSEPTADGPKTVWCVDNRDGSSFYESTAPGYNYANTRRVRCVRTTVPVFASTGSGGAPPVRYTFPADGTVYDTRTTLTWQRAVDTKTYKQPGAQSYCAGLALAGSKWRVPTISELLTIVDPTNYRPAIDATAFPGTPRAEFWSSSPSAGERGNMWYLNFSAGYSYATVANVSSSSFYIRCVH